MTKSEATKKIRIHLDLNCKSKKIVFSEALWGKKFDRNFRDLIIEV